MIRLIASYSKKVPGAEQYSSESASASVEIELPEGANVPAKLAELWTVARNAVDQQLAQRQGQPVNRVAQHVADNGNGNGHHAPAQTQHAPAQTANSHAPQGNGNGRGKAAISDKQKGFVKSLIGELKPLGCDYAFVEAMCQRQFHRGLDYLDRAQASTLIGHLGEIKAGRVTVQQLTA